MAGAGLRVVRAVDRVVEDVRDLDRIAAGATAGLPWCDEPDVDLHPLRVDGADVVVAVNHTAAPVRTRIEGNAWPAGELLELGPKSAHTFFAGKVPDDSAFPAKKQKEEVAR